LKILAFSGIFKTETEQQNGWWQIVTIAKASPAWVLHARTSIKWRLLRTA
jgi:uncharacterized membrane protein